MSTIDAGRAASARGDWRAAYDALAPHRTHLEPEDLARLAEAAWWLGDSPRSMELSEELYQRLLASGQDEQAADRALHLTMEWFIRGDAQVAFSWLARARRLLGTLPPSALHGRLLYLEAAVDAAQVEGEAAPVADRAAQVSALARELDDDVLACLALAMEGIAAVREGRTEHGFACLDEAMLPVLAGRVDPLWSGDLYCTVIHQCDLLADLTRMRAWTEAMRRWSAPRSSSFLYASVNRIHELQVDLADGAWGSVEEELLASSAALVDAHGWLAGEGYYTLGEARRLRGDAAGAREAYALARRFGHDAQPGEALLLAAEGRGAEALAGLRVALADGGPLHRARLLLPAVELLAGSGDAGRAEAADLARELEDTADRFGTPGLRALARRARAVLHRAAGRPREALPLLEEAGRVYRSQRHRYATAQVHEELANAHREAGDDAAARAEEATAVAIYTRLGARPDLERLGPGELPGGLTGREAEVLREVAAGASNRDVARTLVISDKTVSRHLANIFVKVGVSSRTAAAAWARDHGLLP